MRLEGDKKTTPSEALYGFVGWLTSRFEMSGPFSSRHNAAQAADLVAAYCHEQGWAEPRAHFMELIKLGPEKVVLSESESCCDHPWCPAKAKEQ